MKKEAPLIGALIIKSFKRFQLNFISNSSIIPVTTIGQNTMPNHFTGACCQAVRSCIKMTCVLIYGNILFSLFLVLFVLFGGPAMACETVVFAADRRKLMQEYLERGIRVNGEVRRQWTTVETTSSETESEVEKAIVSYEAPADGNHYQMNLIPLDSKTKIEITETRMVQVLILEDYPASGCPQSYIDPDAFSLSLFGRFLLFLAGCGFAAFWAVIPVLIITEHNNAPHLVLIYILVVVGVNFIFHNRCPSCISVQQAQCTTQLQ